MAADLLTKAMALADTYARRRAFHAAHPFTREQDELAAERERDYARQALESFLAEHLAGVEGRDHQTKAPSDVDEGKQ